eukprot:4837834-Alexandrium_andersonii.AAC.1
MKGQAQARTTCPQTTHGGSRAASRLRALRLRLTAHALRGLLHSKDSASGPSSALEPRPPLWPG